MNKKVLSMLVALSMVFTMLPLSMLSDEGSWYREIVAFAELEETEKTIMPGTSLEDLALPEMLTATVLVPKIADSGDIDSAYSKFVVPVPVKTWVSTPEYDIEAVAGTEYVFTPVIERYSICAALPQIKVTVGAPMLREMVSGGTYDIWVGGVQVTDANKGNINGTGIAGIITYDSGSNTLTLNGADITAAYDFNNIFYGIYAGQDINIVLQGTNTTTAEHSLKECIAVSVQNNILTIEGDGSLSATGSSEGSMGYGIIADTLIINGDVALTATGNGGNTSASFGINVGDVTINDGTVIAQGETALGNTSWGIYVNNQATFNGGTITAKGNLAAIMTANTLDISNHTNVRISASTTDSQGNNATAISEETLADSITTYKYLKFEPAAAGFEQFTEITPGNTYYFDLSSQKGKVGTINSALPDTTLHYVPFTYAGTVNAYSLHGRSDNPTTDSVTAAGNTTDPNHVIGYKSDRSLFVGDYVVGTGISWVGLNTNGLIFGEDFDAHYKLRSLSGGSGKTGSASDGADHIGQPESNEWNQILTKSGLTDNETGWIKNWNTIWSFGQDTCSSYHFVVRGNTAASRCDLLSGSLPSAGFRPALEIMNPDGLGADGLKEVTLNLNGSALNGASNINIICAGDSFTAPSGEGLTPPLGRVFDGWRDMSKFPTTAYAAGATVPNTVTSLTAQWGVPRLLNTTTNKGYASLQTAVDAVTDGQTIQLQGSIELSASVTISNSASFTLDLNGFTLDGVAYTAIIHNGSGTLTIVDTESNGLFTSGARSTITLNGGSLIIQSGNIAKPPSLPFDSYAILNSGSGSVSILGGYVRANQYAICNRENGSITIENGTLISVTKSAIQNEKTGKITIKDGASITSAVGGTAGTIHLAGGTMLDTVLEITGGTIKNSAADGHAIYNSASGQISILSGSPVIKGGGMAMNNAPNLSSYTNAEITASKTATDGSATSVIAKTDIDTNEEVQAYKYLKFALASLYEAKVVGGQEYTTFGEAVSAVAEGGTIQLLKNIERSSTYYLGGKIFTLDLNNCTFKGTGYRTIIIDGGKTVTIIDTSTAKDGKITNSYAQGPVIDVETGGTLVLQGGTVEKDNTIYSAIRSSGNLRILGGTVANTATGSAISCGSGSSAVTVEILGDSIVAAQNAPAIRVTDPGSKITIGDNALVTSSCVETEQGTVLFYSSVLEITGGTIENTSTGNAVYTNAPDKIKIPSGSPVIKGGGSAMNYMPNLSDYGKVKVIASTNYDGSTPAAECKPADIASYRYLTFEPATDTTVTDLALTDKLTAPITGGTPATTINGEQYTGTVTWNGSSPTKFLGSTNYTATVTLTAKAGYTFSGVAPNTFTHTGALVNSVTHALGTGDVLTVTVVFPKTATKTLESIVITSPPNKTAYKYGERFSTTGMVVKAIYNDGTEAPLENFSYDKFDPLTMSDTVVKVYYPYGLYPGIFDEQPITVTKADQTIEITAVSGKAYGDAPFTLAVTGGKSTGNVTFTVPDGNGVLILNGSTAAIVGAGTVTVTATKAGDGNYNASNTATREITIAKAAQTISIGAVTGKKYGDAAFTLTASGGSGTGAVTFTVPDDNGVLTLSGSTATIIGAGTVTVTATKAESANHNSVTATKTITVSKAAAPAIIYPTAAGVTYGQALSESALTGGSTQYGSFAWTNGSTVPTVSNSGYEVTFTPSAATVANYEAITPTTSIVAIAVSKAAAPTITFPTAAGVHYGQRLSDSALTGGSTEYGSFAWTDGSTAPTVVNGGYEVTFTPSAHTVANYQEIINRKHTVPLLVSKVDATVTVNAVVSGNAGSRIATLTATVTGVAGGEIPTGSVRFVDSTGTSDADIVGASAVTIVNGQAIYTWTGLADQAYKVKAVYSGSGNYNAATSEEHSFDTRKQAQAALVIGNIGTKTYGDGTFTLSTTGGSGSGAVTFESSDPDIVSILGTTATIHKAGTVAITATKAEDGSFNEKSATVSLTVSKKALTVKADDKLNVIKGATMPTLTHTVTGLVGSDTFTGPTIASADADINTVGEYVISISGGTLSNADNYIVTYKNGRLTVVNAVYLVTVINGTGGGSYSEGATVTVTADTRSGYTFIGWNSDAVSFANSTANETTFTMPGKAVTVTANYRQDSSGGGGDDDGASTTSTPTTRHTSPNVDGSTGAVLQQAITREAATALGRTNNAAILQTQNAESIDPATLQALAQAGKDVVLHADTMLGSAVQGRLYVEPDKFVNTQQPLKLGVYTEPAKTSATTHLFESNFNNKVVTVHMEQQGSLGARLEVAAKANLSELDTKTLYFYSYDKAANLYTRIWNPEYWTDVNGYLHFYTRLGGDIIITDRPLETK